jgi:hypothetical protein
MAKNKRTHSEIARAATNSIIDEAHTTRFSELCVSDRMYTAREINDIIRKVIELQSEFKDLVIQDPEITSYPEVKTLEIKYKEEIPYLNIMFNSGEYSFGPETGVKISSVIINDSTTISADISSNCFNSINISEISGLNDNFTRISSISYNYTDGEPAFNSVGKAFSPELKISANTISTEVSSFFITVLTDGNIIADISAVSSISDLESNEDDFHFQQMLFSKEKPFIYKPCLTKVRQLLILVPENISVEVRDLEDNWPYLLNSKELIDENMKLYYFDLPTAMVNANNYKIIFS